MTVRRCRVEAFKRLARTVTTHLAGILNGFEAGKHNGRVEAMNGSLQQARGRARGHRRVGNLIAMAYLVAGKLAWLPGPAFAQMAVVPHARHETQDGCYAKGIGPKGSVTK